MSKTLTKAKSKELDVWKKAFTDEEVSDGFEVELGFFASFPFLIRNDNGEFEAINTGTGEIDNELGKSIKIVPLYTFGSTKLPIGISKGLSMDDWDNWSDEDKESAAVTYGSLKEGSESYSLGSFAGNEKFEQMLKSSDLGTALKKRFYIIALLPDRYGMKPVILSFGITGKKPWSSYANLLKADKIAPPAVICKVTLQKEKHKTKKQITFFRPVFEVVTKDELPVFSADSPETVKKIYFPIRDEVKAAHLGLVRSVELATEEEEPE